MARRSYVQIKIDGEYKLVPKDEAHRYRPNKSAMIMPDIDPFVSPIDKSVIGGRAARREHMRKHGVIDVGNEKLKPGIKKDTGIDREGLRRELYHVYENVSQEGPR